MELITRTAAAYIRTSTDDQMEVSPDSQLGKIREWAEAHGYDLPDHLIFREEEGVSGRKAKHRDAFNAMVGAAKQKPAPFDTLLVWKFSRFARNQEESVFYKSMLRRQGIEVVSVSEPIIEGPFGQLIERIIEWMDEYYSIRLGEEVKRSMTMLAKEGRHLSIAPFGYVLEDGELQPHPTEAELVREIFRRFTSGDTQKKIAEDLNDRGIKSHRGNLMENRTINYILQNPVYVGKTRWTPTGKRDRYDADNPDTIIADGTHPPLISQDLWDDTQQRLMANRLRHRKNAKPIEQHKSWLSGLIRCSACGSSLIAGGKSGMQCGAYAKGKCTVSHYVSADLLTYSLAYQLRADADDLQRLRIDEAQRKKLAASLSPQYAATLAAIEKKLARLREAYLAGIEDLESYAKAKAELDTQSERIRIALEEEQRMMPHTDPAERRRQLLYAADVIEDPEASMEEKHTAVHNVVSYCIYHKTTKSLEVFYNI